MFFLCFVEQDLMLQIANLRLGFDFLEKKLVGFFFGFGCSKLPSWLAAFAPLNSMLIEEEAWNAYPKCKTGCISFHVPFEDQLLKKCM
jgi:hypothetical protein